LRRELGAPDVRYVLAARGDTREAALEKSEAADAWLAGQVAAGALAGFDLPSRYLPSRRTQEARRSALPDAPTLERSVRAAVARSPFRAGSFAPFLADVARARAGPLLDEDALRGTALGVKLATLLVPDGERWATLAPLRGVGDPARL